jgi:hypothetical protein
MRYLSGVFGWIMRDVGACWRNAENTGSMKVFAAGILVGGGGDDEIEYTRPEKA